MTLTVIATDNVGVASRTLQVNGIPLALDANGQATFLASQLVTLNVAATAADATGNTGAAMLVVNVIDPAAPNRPVITDPTLPTHPGFDPTDNGEPIVEITSPVVNATVSDRVDITGTIDDPEDNLWYWRTYVGRLDRVDVANIDLSDPDYVVTAQGTNEVHNAKIADFDPSLLTNDPYVILVVAYDSNGLGRVQPTLVNVEGAAKLGEFTLGFTDLSIPLAGIPIAISRNYDSREASVEGDFGFGWQLGVQDSRILEVAALSEGGALNPGNDKFAPDQTKVYLTNPSGQRVGFTYREQLISSSLFGAVWRPYFDPDPGVYDTLAIDETQVARGGLVGTLAQGINPSAYTLTTKAGLNYRYSDTGGLQTITDRNQNTITFSEDGVTHSSGESIDFVRDHRGRIKEVIDPDGNKILYGYDLDGDLVSVTNQANVTSSYAYLDTPAHFLDEGFKNDGSLDFKVTYDAENRFAAIVDAQGNVVGQQEYDRLDQNIGVVRDANGNATELLYDKRGNVLEETDPNGNITYREYNDLRNPDLETRIIDRNEIVTDRVYDARGNATQIIELGPLDDPFTQPLVTKFSYNSGNDVTSITNAEGRTTEFEYDGSGNLKLIRNAEGEVSTFTYDSQGGRETFTDFNGNTTTFSDYQGSQPRRVTAADDTYQLFAYNQFGQVTLEEIYEADGTLIQRRETRYDRAGRVTHEISGVAGDSNHPQTEVRRFYYGELLDWEIIVHPESVDGTGNLLESPDTPIAQRKSRITDFEYDPNDRLIRQTDAEGGVVEFRYDNQGNRVLLQDPVGNITTWVYDSLNRMVEERDPLYWEAIVAADPTLGGLANANLLERIAPLDPISPADPLDTRAPLYDEPSGADIDANLGAPHVRVFAYDTEGNRSKSIDRNGRRREFKYDHAGRLETETWFAAADHPLTPNSLVETISFTYDPLGNMLTANDSNSNYLFTYDPLNRLESVDNNPDGTRDVPRVLLTYDYDAQGNVTLTSDDAGVTVESEYDERNQLDVRKWYDADGSGDVDNARVDFDYNAAGP